MDQEKTGRSNQNTQNSNKYAEYKAAILSKISDFSFLFGDLQRQANGEREGWMSAFCPFHQDVRHPSFAFNTSTGRWKCFAGCGGGGPIDFIMIQTGKSFLDAMMVLGDHVGVPRPSKASKPPQAARPPIKETLIDKWHENLLQNEEIRRWLNEKRGLSDETLKFFKIGWDPKRERNTIPIRDLNAEPVNVRLYNAKKQPKIINYTEGKWKYGSPARLFCVEKIKNAEEVIICEGEWDCIILNQEGFAATTGTHGCSTFRPEWVDYYTDKHVVLIYDTDSEGKSAVNRILLPAFKVAILEGKVKSIKVVVLPLAGTADDKDVSDYFTKRGATAADLRALIDSTPVHEYEKAEVTIEAEQLESFTKIESKELIDHKVVCDITICGETSEAFHAVEEFKVSFCPKLRKGECFDCVEPIKIPHGSREYIGSCMSSDYQVQSMLRDYCCKKYQQRCGIDILRRTTVKEFFAHQRVDRITHKKDENGNIVQLYNGKQQELMEKRCYYISDEHPRPGNYRATGWIKSHPKTQQITMLIEHLKPLIDDFESFDLQKNRHLIEAWKQIPWDDKLADLEHNVTRVYERDEVLIAALLTFCSPRWIPFNGEVIRGWLVTMILGDSGAGKTQTYTRLSEFCGIGDSLSGLTGSRTGLAYALVEHKQKGWQVRIGRYPANSRKILMVDEAQHLPEQDVRTISKAMEEGFLQIDRVQSKGYESETRLILIANPKDDKTMDEFSYGCLALTSFLPSTIIRRLDMAVFLNSGDLKNFDLINRRWASPGEETKNQITPDMLRAVIHWAWNLTPDRIRWQAEAETACLKFASELAEKFGWAFDCPLVTIADIRKTIARVAAAFAVLWAATPDGGESILIEKGHVHVAVRYLDSLYSCDAAGLSDYSTTQKAASQLLDYERIERIFLEKKEKEKHSVEKGFFSSVVSVLRTVPSIKREDLAEQVGCSTETIKDIVKLLKKYNLLDSNRHGYFKKPKFNKFLRRFLRINPNFLIETADWKEQNDENDEN